MPRHRPTPSDSLAANLSAARAILAGLTEHEIYTSEDPAVLEASSALVAAGMANYSRDRAEARFRRQADALIAEYWEDTLP